MTILVSLLLILLWSLALPAVLTSVYVTVGLAASAVFGIGALLWRTP